LFDSYFEHRIIHTGQNFENNMKDIFFEELGVRQPDLQIKIEHYSIGSTLSSIFLGVEKELSENRPDAVVILGDTNSSLSVIIAKRLKIPVYHLEAGNRSFDLNVPEEINRHIVDHFADFNMAYTNHAKENLLREGIHPRNISVIGSDNSIIDITNYDSETGRIAVKSTLYGFGIAYPNSNIVDGTKYYDVSLPAFMRHISKNIDGILAYLEK
jgi:UDP-N-acetylglucosamine 2-epimerase